MNRKEFLIIAVAIFLTIVAWVVIDIYHIQRGSYINQEIPPVKIPQFNFDTSLFPQLLDKKP